MRFYLVLTALVAASSAAIAAPKSMICNNGMHDYQVKFDEARRSFILNGDIKYRILAIEKSHNSSVIAGSTVNGGPSFRAVLNGAPHIDFYTDEKLDQTDRCHY